MSSSTVTPETPAAPQVTEREARAVAEAAREKEWTKDSFVRELFLGRLRMDLIDPIPSQDPEESARGREFIGTLPVVKEETTKEFEARCARWIEELLGRTSG